MTDNTEKCTHCHRCQKGCDPCAHCGVCQRCGQHRMPVANPPQFVPIPVQIPRTQPEPWMPPPFEIWCGPIGVGNDSWSEPIL